MDFVGDRTALIFHQSDSFELHCASLLCTIYCVSSARRLKTGRFSAKMRSLKLDLFKLGGGILPAANLNVNDFFIETNATKPTPRELLAMRTATL